MISWGIIGLGNIARRFAQSLQGIPGHRLYGVASRDEHKQRQFQERYHALWATADYNELICSENIDIVYIALPHKFHAPWLRACIKAHKPVLCEKPLTLSCADTREILALAEQSRVFVSEALKGVYLPATKELVHDLSRIGSIREIRASFSSVVPYQPGRYLFEKGQGGAFNDVGIYPVAFADTLTGQNPLQISVSCSKAHDIDTWFEAVLTYPGDTRAILSGAIDREASRTAEITGTKGTITVPYYYRPLSYEINGATKNFAVSGDDMTGEIIACGKAVQAGQLETAEYPRAKMLRIAGIMDEIRRAISDA